MAAPLASLLFPARCWQSKSMKFVLCLPRDAAGKIGIMVFVERLSRWLI